jgi:predicted regulator of Ras-like GTPase activity (Roadblock/LC7/MglB family)
MSKQEDLARVVYTIREAIPELNGIMIASNDGLPISSDMPGEEAERIAAMGATAAGLGKRMAERSNIGEMHENVVRGEHGFVVVYTAGDSAVLVLSGPTTSNLGLMRIEAKTASPVIAKLLR